MKYYSVICHIATGIVITAGRWSGWLVLFSNTEVNWYKVQIYGAIGCSRGKANPCRRAQYRRPELVLVVVFEFMFKSDLSRIDKW